VARLRIKAARLDVAADKEEVGEEIGGGMDQRAAKINKRGKIYKQPHRAVLHETLRKVPGESEESAGEVKLA
jgi:hypothetical protein